MGVTTMPVREALMRLANEGLVIADTNRLFTVAMSVMPAAIWDIYWIQPVQASGDCGRVGRRTNELIAVLTRRNEAYMAVLKTSRLGRSALLA